MGSECGLEGRVSSLVIGVQVSYGSPQHELKCKKLEDYPIVSEEPCFVVGSKILLEVDYVSQTRLDN